LFEHGGLGGWEDTDAPEAFFERGGARIFFRWSDPDHTLLLIFSIVKDAPPLANSNCFRAMEMPMFLEKRWWRRGELNPRPKQTHQPRLHA
jgi:hypothetical protein